MHPSNPASLRKRASLTLFLIAALLASGIAAKRAQSALDGFNPNAISQGEPAGPPAPTNKITPWVIGHTADGQQAEFMVVLVDQADLRPAAALATKSEKGRYVYDALRAKSQTTQGPILQWLRERGIEHRSFYILNAVLVKGPREVLPARPGIRVLFP